MIQGKIIKSLRDKGFGGLLPNGLPWLFLKTQSVVAIPRTQGALMPEKGNKEDFLAPLIFVVLLRLLFLVSSSVTKKRWWLYLGS